ncbi:MAG: hypothetical protein IKO05_09925 [Selenomonadaceae bacterium]|nr:hypothetical protein [Selenomonadaceae bacterium]
MPLDDFKKFSPLFEADIRDAIKPKTCARIAASLTGEKNPFFGKHHTNSTHAGLLRLLL